MELKAGEWSLPVGIYPELKDMKERLRDSDIDFIFVSMAPLAETLLSHMLAAGIKYVIASSIDEAVKKLSDKIGAERAEDSGEAAKH